MASIRDLIRDNVKRIVPYSPGKVSDEVRRELGIQEVTKLASNENPLGPSPFAVEAMREAAPDVRLYPDPTCFDLTRDLAEHLDVEPDNVIIGRGSDEVIHMLGLAFLRPGDEVIYASPPFALYPYTATVMDCRSVVVPVRDYTHDLEAMAEAVTPNTRMIFIANPHNPTGTSVTRDQADRFMAAVPDDVIVVWDEAYYEYVATDEFPDTFGYWRDGRKAVVLRTFSKIYALAGLRIGYGVASAEMIRALRLVLEPFNVSSIAQAAARASLRDSEQVARSRRVNEEGKAFLYGRFDAMGLTYVPTQANFVFVDVGRHSAKVFDRMMRRGVTVRTGDIWGWDTWIRVTIGTREQNEKFLAALQSALAAQD
ncbi:MAG: histidinol-phosphate transaminase [Armatimonadota bacterium]